MTNERPESGAWLSAARIWLSGSIPPELETGRPEDAERIRKFVRQFARAVFDGGGTMIHGSHPSITPLLLDEGRRFADRDRETGSPNRLRAPLQLVVSDYFVSDEGAMVDLTGWNAVCRDKVIVTTAVPLDESGPGRARDRSLAVMRRTISGLSNVIVAVGGKWWTENPERAGVPEEIDFARDNLLPLFLLGGLGGATRTWLELHPDYVAICANGLSDDANLALTASVDIPHAVDTIIRQIARLRPPPQAAPRAVSGSNQPSATAEQPNPETCEDANKPPFRRILCLDGGGIRGAFTAKVLADWQQASGLRIADHFDLIVGTSTGGILAIALGMGLEPAELVDFYREHGPRIFPGGGLVGRWLTMKHWFAPKFDRSVLEQSIEAALSKAPVTSDLLADSQVRLVITTYDAETDSPKVFRTPHIDSGFLDARVTRLEAAMATSAAPTYFDFTQVDYTRAIDGGVWANSPTLVALAEAAQLGWDLRSVRLLSIGTLYTPNLLAQPLEIDAQFIEKTLNPVLGKWKAKLVSWACKPIVVGGKLGWLPTIANLLMKTQAQAAERIAKALLGDGANFVRVDLATPSIAMDDAASINSLLSYGETAAGEWLTTVSKMFLIAGSPASKWKKRVRPRAPGRP